MKKILILIVSILLLFSCKNIKRNITTNSNNGYFKVEVVQNGKVLKEKNHVIYLKKQPFKFTFSKIKGVYVSILHHRNYYDYPIDTNIFMCNQNHTKYSENCLFVRGQTIAEESFNSDKTIYIHTSNSHSYWFYNKELDWHRMDKGIRVKNGLIYAERTVENIDDEGKTYPIKEIVEDIYMVFAAKDVKEGIDASKELQRKKIHLKFK